MPDASQEPSGLPIHVVIMIMFVIAIGLAAFYYFYVVVESTNAAPPAQTATPIEQTPTINQVGGGPAHHKNKPPSREKMRQDAQKSIDVADHAERHIIGTNRRTLPQLHSDDPVFNQYHITPSSQIDFKGYQGFKNQAVPLSMLRTHTNYQLSDSQPSNPQHPKFLGRHYKLGQHFKPSSNSKFIFDLPDATNATSVQILPNTEINIQPFESPQLAYLHNDPSIYPANHERYDLLTGWKLILVDKADPSTNNNNNDNDNNLYVGPNHKYIIATTEDVSRYLTRETGGNSPNLIILTADQSKAIKWNILP